MKGLLRSMLFASLLAAGAQAAPLAVRPSQVVADGIRLVRGSTVVTIKKLTSFVGTAYTPLPLLPTGGKATPFGEGWSRFEPVVTAANKAYCYTWGEENPKANTPVTIFVIKGGAEVERYTFQNAWVKFCGGGQGYPFTYSMLYSGGTYTTKSKPAAKVASPKARALPAAAGGGGK